MYNLYKRLGEGAVIFLPFGRALCQPLYGWSKGSVLSEGDIGGFCVYVMLWLTEEVSVFRGCTPYNHQNSRRPSQTLYQVPFLGPPCFSAPCPQPQGVRGFSIIPTTPDPLPSLCPSLSLKVEPTLKGKLPVKWSEKQARLWSSETLCVIFSRSLPTRLQAQAFLPHWNPHLFRCRPSPIVEQTGSKQQHLRKN